MIRGHIPTVYGRNMIKSIVDKIAEKLKTGGLEISSVDFSELVNRTTGAISKPVANISINSGKFKKITLTTFQNEITISIYLMVQELRGEGMCRQVVSELIDGIVQLLLMDDLDGTLQEKLSPSTFTNVTDQKYSDAGYLIYKIDFYCSYNITATGKDEDNRGMLKGIFNKYYLDGLTQDLTREVNTGDLH